MPYLSYSQTTQKSVVRFPKPSYSIVLWLLPAFLIGGALLQGKVLYWGLPVLQFIPWRVFAYEQVLKGELFPLWNPLSGMGAPLLANYQLAWFYPPSWILSVFYLCGGTPWLAWGYTFLTILHLVWAGWGMMRLMKRLECGVLAQVVAGIAFGFSQYFIARINFFSMIWAGAWLPWVISGVDEVFTVSSEVKAAKTKVLSLTFVLAMQLLAGHAQLTWYTWLLAFMWGIVRFPWGKKRFGPLIGGLVALLWAVGLTLIQLLPTAEYLLNSQRASQVHYEQAMTYSLWPWRLTGFLTPNLFGNPGLDGYWGYANYWEDAVYIGILPLLMALVTLKKALRVWRKGQVSTFERMIIFLWGIVAVGILLALGKNTPFYVWLYRYVPTFDMFQAPSRWLIWAIFGLSVLSGIGIEIWRKPEGRVLYGLRLSVAGAIAIMFSAWWASHLLSDLKSSFANATFQLGWTTLGAVMILLLTPSELAPLKHRLGWGWLFLTWVVVDILVSSRGLIPVASMEIYRPLDPPHELQPLIRRGRLYLPSPDEYDLKFKRFFRFDHYETKENARELRVSLLPNLNLLASVSSLNNFDPLQPGCYNTLITFIESQPEPLKAAWLEDLNVAVVEYHDERSSLGIKFHPLNPKERWQWFACLEIQPSLSSALRRMGDVINSDSRCLILAGGQDSVEEEKMSLSTASVLPVSEKSNMVALEVETTGSGWLRLADLWYPGWKVIVDGHPQPLLQVDGCLRAVFLTTGKHFVQFVYAPLSFSIGASVSLLAWLVWLWVARAERINKKVI
ncbi:MAG: YfhO family protein [Thermanaerothrix sp.]|nr:YfhO family protein [Thermanaerothrix sp.]